MTEYQSHIIMAGYSPSAKIRAPCALQASLQIFGRRMRTDAAFAARFASSPPQPTEKPPLRVAFLLAGMAGFGPTNAGVKVPCLTAWRHPIAAPNRFIGSGNNCFYKCQLLTLKFSSMEGGPFSEEFTTEIKVFPRLMVKRSPPIPEITSSAVSFARLQIIGTYLPSEI